jgi:hypothetical protein
MGKDRDSQFDVSAGLAFGLKAFEMYRKSGILTAEVRSVPFIRGRCQAYLEIAQGKVVSCYLIDRQGERHSITRETLVQLDEAKGPFSWVFHANTEPDLTAFSPEQVVHTRPSSSSPSPIPRPLVYTLDLRPFQQWWTPRQLQYLHMIFSLIDGKRSIDEIKAQVALSPLVVDEGIRILLQLQAIAIP